MLAVLAMACGAAMPAPAQEATYPAEAWKMLDTFEAHNLGKADKTFNDRKYRQATAEFDAFIKQFPNSKAIPYALLRKGRAMHLDKKRFEAIAVYQEILDYFPDDIPFAAPAIYNIGLAHQENGDLEKALTAWIKMADDEDYAKHPLAASALFELGSNLEKQEKYDRALQYYEQVAVNFRTSNSRRIAHDAIRRLVYHHIRRKPSEAGFRAVYLKMQGIGDKPLAKMPKELEADIDYWQTLRGQVDDQERHFTKAQEDERAAYYKYWAGAMGGRFPNNDDYQIALAVYRRRFESDAEKKWVEFLDRQYAQDVNRGGYHPRIFKWLRLFQGNQAKIEEYYGKCRFKEMKNDTIVSLMKLLFDDAKVPMMGENVYEKIKMGEMPDGEKMALAHYLWTKSDRLVLLTYSAMKDQEMADLGRLRFYHSRKDSGSGIPLAQKLTSSADHAAEAWWKLAELYAWKKDWQEAISAYRKSEKLPDALWCISDCFVKLGKTSEAIAALQEVENFFKNYSAEAALRMSFVYRAANQRPQQEAALRNVLKKYPKSKQSSTAHLELEKLGVSRIGGGMNAE